MKKILLIDQDPNTLEKLQTSLSRAGYNVLMAADGNAGLRLARVDQPDLIIMDILLIGLDGLEMSQQLRQDECTRNIPVFLITSLTIPSKNEPWQPTPYAKWQLLHYNAYLPKPVDLNQVVRKVEALLNPDKRLSQPTGPTVFLVTRDNARRAALQQEMLGEDFDVSSYDDLATALPAIYSYLPAGLIVDADFLTVEAWSPLKRFQDRNPAFTMVILQHKSAPQVSFELERVDHIINFPAPPWQVIMGVKQALESRYLKSRVKSLSTQILTLNRDLLDSKQTLQYQNQELDLINRNLKDLSELKEMLTGMLVHDLKAPLAAIMGAMQFLEMDPRNSLSEPSKRIISGGLAAAHQMLRMTHTLLDEQKLENNQLVFDIEATDLEDPLETSLEMMSPLFNLERVTVETDIPEDLPVLQADPIILQRIIENLLDNAVKYSPADEVVTVQAIARNEFVEVIIADRGPGIPEEHRQLIFDRFTQLQTEGIGKIRGGVGLGLAFCKMAIETMGGRIWVDSPNNVGTAFHFSLPVAPPDES